MTDAENDHHDPYGHDAAWADRLFGSVGMKYIGEFWEAQTIIVAATDIDLISVTFQVEGSSRDIPAMGGLLFDRRLTDDDLDHIEADMLQVFSILEIAMDNIAEAEIERRLSYLPLKAYRIERGRTAPLMEAKVCEFDWRPELPGLVTVAVVGSDRS